MEYVALLLIAYLVPLAAWIAGEIGRWWWLPWLSLVIALPLGRRVWTANGAAFNPLLAATARLGLVFALLQAGSILL
jgi:1,4-dihydroxy-2-naphthoate octaprenyltransferase